MWLRLIAAPRNTSLQTGYRINTRIFRRNLNAPSASAHEPAECFPITIAGNRHDGEEIPEDLSEFETKPWVSPAIPRPSQCSRAGLQAGLNHEHASIQSPASGDLCSHSLLEKRSSRSAACERAKDNKLLVNRLLKDKGQLSYDWRVPFDLLLRQHDKHLDTQISDVPERLYRPVFVDVPDQDKLRLQTHHQNKPRFARDIVQPEAWSESTIIGYLRALANSHYNRDEIPQCPQARSKRQSNAGDIVKAFDSIFHSPVTRRHLTIKAYNIALRFYYSHGLFSKARSLFLQLEDSRMKIPTETFNEVLKGAASSHDLYSFTSILHKGIQLGFKPDGETWNMLLMAVNSDEIKSIITQRMKEKGLIDIVPRQGVIRLIVQNEVASHIDRLTDRGAILFHLDKVYGITWLTTSTGNKLLYEFSKRTSLPATLALLPGMKRRGFVPDEVSLITLLQQCLQSRQHMNAIETLRAFHYEFGRQPGREALEIMFRLAWQSRLITVAKYIWNSAAVRGHITYKMRDLARRSLLAKGPPQELVNKRLRFERLFGTFVVSVTPPDDFRRLKLKPNFEPRHGESILNTAKTRLQDGHPLARTIGLPQDFAKRLLQALEQDLRWAVKTKSGAGDTMETRIELAAVSILRKFMTSTSPTKHDAPISINQESDRANNLLEMQNLAPSINTNQVATTTELQGAFNGKADPQDIRRRTNRQQIRASHRVSSPDASMRDQRSNQRHLRKLARRLHEKKMGFSISSNKTGTNRPSIRRDKSLSAKFLRNELRPANPSIGRGARTYWVRARNKQATPISPGIQDLPPQFLIRKHRIKRNWPSAHGVREESPAAFAKKELRRPCPKPSSEDSATAAERLSAAHDSLNRRIFALDIHLDKKRKARKSLLKTLLLSPIRKHARRLAPIRKYAGHPAPRTIQAPPSPPRHPVTEKEKEAEASKPVRTAHLHNSLDEMLKIVDTLKPPTRRVRGQLARRRILPSRRGSGAFRPLRGQF